MKVVSPQDKDDRQEQKYVIDDCFSHLTELTIIPRMSEIPRGIAALQTENAALKEENAALKNVSAATDKENIVMQNQDFAFKKENAAKDCRDRVRVRRVQEG